MWKQLYPCDLEHEGPRTHECMSGHPLGSATDSDQSIDLYVLHAAIPLCIGVAIYDLSNAHAHEHEGPQYPYMHIRTKGLPLGSLHSL